MRRWGVLVAVGAVAAAPPALPWLPDLVKTDGYAAVAPALQAFDAAWAPGKKRDQALAASGLGEVTLRTVLGVGANLALSDPSPLGGCTWDGSLHCGLSVAAPAGVTAADFEVKCRLGQGPGVPMQAEAVPGAPGRLAWRVHGVETCWKLSVDAVVIAARAREDLEGMGQGDDLIPPEIVGLSQDQVEATLKERVPALAVCTRKFSADKRAVAGKMVVAYRIGPNGAMAEAKLESSTFADPQIERCVLDGFLRLRFPPVNDGFDHGTFPITFVGGA